MEKTWKHYQELTKLSIEWIIKCVVTMRIDLLMSYRPFECEDANNQLILCLLDFQNQVMTIQTEYVHKELKKRMEKTEQ